MKLRNGSTKDVKRLAQYIDMSAGADACWPWTAAVGQRWGYGQAWLWGKGHNAHRAFWMALKGELPADKVVCHKCDNPICCNPAHLWIGTQADNLEDCRNKKRQTYLYGKQHHRSAAKICEEDVRRIREAYLFGAKQRDLGAIYGVHSATISRIISRQYWGHVA